MNRANYYIVEFRKDRVFIADLGGPHKSITNDAERVVAEVNHAHPGHRIIYKDTEGEWDELLHDKGKFTGFKPYREDHPQ